MDIKRDNPHMTLRESFLAMHAEDGMLIDTLNERLASWIDEYHSKEHSVI
jgi:hypothetical protein